MIGYAWFSSKHVNANSFEFIFGPACMTHRRSHYFSFMERILFLSRFHPKSAKDLTLKTIPICKLRGVNGVCQQGQQRSSISEPRSNAYFIMDVKYSGFEKDPVNQKDN